MRAEITDSLLERRPFKRGVRIHISDSRLTGLAVIIGGRKKVILLRKDGRELARWVWPVVDVCSGRRRDRDWRRGAMPWARRRDRCSERGCRAWRAQL